MVLDTFYIRVRHLKNNAGTLQLNDLRNTEDARNPYLKIPSYLGYGNVVDLPLTDAVLQSYKRGSIKQYQDKKLVDAFILKNENIVNVITSEYQISPSDSMILVDTSLGDVTLFLPPLSLVSSSSKLMIKKISTDSNNVFIFPIEDDKLENTLNPKFFNESLGAYELRSTDSSWWVTSKYPVHGGTGSSSILFAEEIFDLTEAPATNIFVVPHTPIANSEKVYWNGIHLTKGVDQDYVAVGSAFELVPDIQLSAGHVIVITYSYEQT